jgi:hypothetical protein
MGIAMSLNAVTAERPARRRYRWLRVVATLVVIASTLGSVLSFVAWSYIRVSGPVDRTVRAGSTVRRWVADANGIALGKITQSPSAVSGGPPAGISTGSSFRIYTTRASWRTHFQEWHWFRVTGRTERRFIPPIGSNQPLSDDEIRAHPGTDVNTDWVVVYPGRLSATLAIPSVAWLLFLADRVFSRSLVEAERNRRPDGYCPRCDYDLRATPSHCPECGWVGPPLVDCETLADALAEVR